MTIQPPTPQTAAAQLATSQPVRGFLDWPAVTDPALRRADVAMLGVPLSEPYPFNPHPNDRAGAPDWVRRQSFQFCDGAAHWGFDLGAPSGKMLPARCIDIGNLVWDGRDYPTYLQEVGSSGRR